MSSGVREIIIIVGLTLLCGGALLFLGIKEIRANKAACNAKGGIYFAADGGRPLCLKKEVVIPL